MIYTNVLSVFKIHHHLNGLGNKNLRLIQEIMHTSEPATENYKKVCEDYPNFAILTKSATPGEVELTFGYATVGNKSYGESVAAFSLARDLISPSIVSIIMASILPQTETRSVSRSRRFSFAPPPATSGAQRIIKTGRRETPSYSRHSPRKPQSSIGSQIWAIS